MSDSGVIPPHEDRGAVRLCDAPYDASDFRGLYCERPAGHPGQHECNITVDWPQEAP